MTTLPATFMSPVAQLELVLGLLLAVVLLELAARRVHLPPAAAFIVGGIALALAPGSPNIELDPDLVIVLFLPPLLMSGASFTVWREFRENLPGILLLAIGAVAFTTLVVGLATHWMIPSLPGQCAFIWRHCVTARCGSGRGSSGGSQPAAPCVGAAARRKSAGEATLAFGVLTIGDVLIGGAVGLGSGLTT